MEFVWGNNYILYLLEVLSDGRDTATAQLSYRKPEGHGVHSTRSLRVVGLGSVRARCVTKTWPSLPSLHHPQHIGSFFPARLPWQLVLVPSLMSISRPITEKQWICCDCLLRPILSLTKIRFVSKKEEKGKKRRRKKGGGGDGGE